MTIEDEIIFLILPKVRQNKVSLLKNVAYDMMNFYESFNLSSRLISIMRLQLH